MKLGITITRDNGARADYGIDLPVGEGVAEGDILAQVLAAMDRTSAHLVQTIQSNGIEAIGWTYPTATPDPEPIGQAAGPSLDRTNDVEEPPVTEETANPT